MTVDNRNNGYYSVDRGNTQICEEVGTVDNQRVSWRSLRLIDINGEDGNEARAEDCITQLREFRETGCMFDWFFTRLGLPHETDDPSTWGPVDAAAVDWTGFPGDIRVAYVHTNGGDYIALPDGSLLSVTPEVFANYCNAWRTQDDFSDWHGEETWEGNDILTAFDGWGEILSYYAGGALRIPDAVKFGTREDFYGYQESDHRQCSK